MGVTGLWRLVEPTGKPVPVETLENKVLAVDISIWLHQVVKGYQDAKGAPMPNAHLLGLFQRLCKLLYFRIKPVFVFDGAFPELKKETIARRQDNKLKYNSESERLKRELVLLLGKKTAITSILGQQISPKKSSTTTESNDDIFKLPPIPAQVEDEIESESDEDTSSGSIIDLHSVDLEADSFKKLDVKEKYNLLLDLKETRKMNSWGRLHELPKKSDTFSDFQLQRLLKRRKVYECLQETEKEMGASGMSLNELESILNEEGIDTKMECLPTKRIASSDSTRFLLINNVKKALAEAKERKNKENENLAVPPTTESSCTIKEEIKPEKSSSKVEKTDELEDDLEKAIKMSLECVEEPSSSSFNKTDESWTTVMSDSDYSDSEDDAEYDPPSMSTAKAYIMQYSDFTNKAISKIIASKKSTNDTKHKIPNVEDILEDLEKQDSIIVDKIALSSDDENIQHLDNKIKLEYSSDSDNTSKSDSTNKDLVFVNSETQASVVILDNEPTKVYSLDESLESAAVDKTSETENRIQQPQSAESENTDDEFEEVPYIEAPSSKPVVQLTLDVGQAPEDDIFADIFSPVKDIKNEPKITNEDNIDYKGSLIQSVFNINDELTTANKKREENKNTTNLEEIVINKSIIEEKYRSPPSNKNNVSDISNELENTKNNDENIEISDKETLIKHNKQIEDRLPTQIPVEQLNTMVENIQNEEENLMQEKSRLDRMGRNITEQMTKEAQELLQIFGIPYIVAPMEAEAQCAFLESVNLTDGTITDDSDIWLFGGKTVYKNFFNQKKHVLQFLAERIEKSFNLSRDQLVLLALLVGSDYTTGVNGVGPVTAMEILASFPYSKKQLQSEMSNHEKYLKLIEGLQEFKQWVKGGRRTDNINLKKKLKNVDVGEDFPSVRVVKAYFEPNVEKSEDKFSWGQLDITILRDYAKAKFGWSQYKLDEIIQPVLKRLQDKKAQRSLQDYFKRKIDFENLEDQMSKRVKAAVRKMGPEDLIANNEEVLPSKPKRQRKVKKKAVIIPEASCSSANQNLEVINDATLPDAEKRLTEENQDTNIESKSIKNVVKIQSVAKDTKKPIVDIRIRKTDRYQEVIPQREKDKQHLLQNKMKAIETFRKTTLDPKSRPKKRRVIVPKEKADLSESSDSN